jgi:hypothetical protein
VDLLLESAREVEAALQHFFQNKWAFFCNTTASRG